ncbi:MAG: hypothetical protein E6J42_12820 [Chloroflexi bacterium]|nr:MAG: hypothetical protein E6J42_12820 [Chloroflexota bacterium]
MVQECERDDQDDRHDRQGTKSEATRLGHGWVSSLGLKERRWASRGRLSAAGGTTGKPGTRFPYQQYG